MKKCYNCEALERQVDYFSREANRYEDLYRDLQKFIVSLVIDSEIFESTVRGIARKEIDENEEWHGR